MSNHYCCVPQCSSWAKRNNNLSFHTFPRAGRSKVIFETKLKKELVCRRKVWINLLKIGKKVTNTMRVCSLHFVESDFFPKGHGVKRTMLKSLAIPSKNLPVGTIESQPGPSRKSTPKKSPTYATEECSINVLPCENDVEDEGDREAAETLLALFNTQKRKEVLEAGPSNRNIGVQVNTPKTITICELIISDEHLTHLEATDPPI